MRETHDADLKRLTTVRIGGTADRLLEPESTQELLELIRTEHPCHFVGGGSNLLVNDRTFDLVVSLKSFDKSLESYGEGNYRVGASMRLPSLINSINRDGYGGIEYLCNVPGLVGGAIAMNAGTGRAVGKSISDYLISVDVIENGEIVTMPRDLCGFDYRNSIFKGSAERIITSALFCFPAMPQDKIEEAKAAKMRLYRKRQDPSHPNFGSVFSRSNRAIMRLARLLALGGKVHFSRKTTNWIVNEGGGYNDAIDAISKVERIHKRLHKECKREVIVWE